MAKSLSFSDVMLSSVARPTMPICFWFVLSSHIPLSCCWRFFLSFIFSLPYNIATIVNMFVFCCCFWCKLVVKLGFSANCILNAFFHFRFPSIVPSFFPHIVSILPCDLLPFLFCPFLFFLLSLWRFFPLSLSSTLKIDVIRYHLMWCTDRISECENRKSLKPFS